MTDKPSICVSPKALKYVMSVLEFHKNSVEKSREFYKTIHHKSNFSGEDYEVMKLLLNTFDSFHADMEKQFSELAEETADWKAGVDK